MADPLFHAITPGTTIPGDWFAGAIPANIQAGGNSMIDSAFCFKSYRSRAPVGLRIGSHVTICNTAIATEPDATIEIGDYCYLTNAVLISATSITLGSHVLVANGVTIVDSDFHPIDPGLRTIDSIVLSPKGNRASRPTVTAKPIVVEDDVWIGFNATILKGVRIGRGAVIEPGAVVIGDVPAGEHVAGNPARKLPKHGHE